MGLFLKIGAGWGWVADLSFTDLLCGRRHHGSGRGSGGHPVPELPGAEHSLHLGFQEGRGVIVGCWSRAPRRPTHLSSLGAQAPLARFPQSLASGPCRDPGEPRGGAAGLGGCRTLSGKSRTRPSPPLAQRRFGHFRPGALRQVPYSPVGNGCPPAGGAEDPARPGRRAAGRQSGFWEAEFRTGGGGGGSSLNWKPVGVLAAREPEEQGRWEGPGQVGAWGRGAQERVRRARGVSCRAAGGVRLRSGVGLPRASGAWRRTPGP